MQTFFKILVNSRIPKTDNYSGDSYSDYGFSECADSDSIYRKRLDSANSNFGSDFNLSQLHRYGKKYLLNFNNFSTTCLTCWASFYAFSLPIFLNKYVYEKNWLQISKRICNKEQSETFSKKNKFVWSLLNDEIKFMKILL